MLGVPESARWLFNHGYDDKAIAALQEIYDAPEDDPRIQRQKKDVLEVLEMERQQGRFRWRDILKRDDIQTGRRVLLAYGMQFMNQVGGINFVVLVLPVSV